MTSLKPCPFCGALGEVVKKDKDCFYPRCVRYEICGCETNGGSTEAEAIAVWNRRPLEDEQAAKIEKLKKVSVELYNQGYLSGHHDTVEGQYADIHSSDMKTYHSDIVYDLLQELKGSNND